MAELSIYTTTSGESCGDKDGAKSCGWFSDTDGWFCQLFGKSISPCNPARTKFARCVECHKAETRVSGRNAQLAGQSALIKEQSDIIIEMEQDSLNDKEWVKKHYENG